MDEFLDETALRRIAERLLRDAADRDDAIQEMWLASLESGAPMDGATTGWKVNTMRHRARRIWDRRRRRAVAEAAAQPPRQLPDPSEELDRRSIRELLQATLDKLPRLQAEVIRARFFEDLSLEEIALRMDAPSGTIRARLSRGLAEMRRRLDERTGDPRLTALALIRGFDWPPGTVVAKAAAGGSGFALLVAGIAGVLAVSATLGWLLLGGGGDPQASDVRGLQVASTEARSSASDLVPSRSGVRREPVPIPAAAGSDAQSARESVPPGEEEAPEAALAVDEMRVTLVGLDESGAPLADFEAKAWLPADRTLPFVGPAGPDGRLTLTVTKDHLWEYFRDAIEDTILETILEEGTFVKVSVQSPGTVRHPDLHVPFEPGSAQEIEVRFDPRPGELLGRVVGRYGEPVPMVSVSTLVRREWSEGELTLCLPDDFRQCNENGWFRFADLEPGKTCFWLRKPGFVPSKVEVVTAAGERVERTFVLERAVPVVGTVRDATGRPVEGARVLPDRDRSKPGEWVRTAVDGSFTLSSLPAGSHQLWVYGPVATSIEDHATTETLTLVRDEVVWNPILGSGSELTVQVFDAEGWPVPGQLVLFLREEANSADEWWDVVVTDDEGSATVKKVPDQAIRAELRAGKGDSSSGMGKAPFRVLEGLRARPQPYRLQLEAGDLDLGRVRGSLLLADGSPCIDATLSIKGPLSRVAEICDLEQGSFEIEQLSAGEHLLLVGRPLGGYWSTRFHLAPGEELDLGALRLPPPGTLRIRNGWPLEDAEGRPLTTQLSVTLQDLDGPKPYLSGQAPVARLAEFELLPGEVTIRVCVAGYYVDSNQVTVRSGEVTEVEFVPPFDPADPFLPEVRDKDGD